MKPIIITFIISILNLSNAHANSDKRTYEDDLSYLTHLKKHVWPKIYKTSDVAGLDDLTHEDFVIVDPKGVTTTKSEELAFLKNYTWPHNEFEYVIQRIKIFENDTAIVAGRGRASGKGEKGNYCFTYVSTNVLVKVSGKWKAIQSHVSGYKPQCE